MDESKTRILIDPSNDAGKIMNNPDSPTPTKGLWPMAGILRYGAMLLILLMLVCGPAWSNSVSKLSGFSPAAQIKSNRFKPPMENINYEKCNSSIASEARHFNFNIATQGATAQQWHFLDSSPPESRGRLRGEVTFIRGDMFQESDIEVGVTITSNNKEDFENVAFRSSDSVLGLDYKLTDETETCTDVQIVVSLRPWPEHRLQVFEVKSEVLHLTFRRWLHWHANELIIHTSYGDIDYDGNTWSDPFTADNVSMSSVGGTLFSELGAVGNLTFENVNGDVGVVLYPTHSDYCKLERITVSTESGDVHGGNIHHEWPTGPHKHITNIQSQSGELWASIPHGLYTNISTIRGNIFAYMQPFPAASPGAQSEFYTHLETGGETYVILTETHPDQLDDFYSPLLNMTSRHYVGEGTLKISYPYDWYGTMEAKIEHGTIEFDSTKLEDFEHAEGYVKVQRGKIGSSRLDVVVGTGKLKVTLGLGY